MNKPLPPSQDAINARARRRRNFVIPKIYQQHYEELEDDTLEVMRVHTGYGDFNLDDY